MSPLEKLEFYIQLNVKNTIINFMYEIIVLFSECILYVTIQYNWMWLLYSYQYSEWMKVSILQCF